MADSVYISANLSGEQLRFMKLLDELEVEYFHCKTKCYCILVGTQLTRPDRAISKYHLCTNDATQEIQDHSGRVLQVCDNSFAQTHGHFLQRLWKLPVSHYRRRENTRGLL